jgi:hypothetical protein
MCVDDVEASAGSPICAPTCEAAAHVGAGACELAGAGCELEQLDFQRVVLRCRRAIARLVRRLRLARIVEAAQRGDLVADETPALGMGGVGEHVGDHERPHDPPTVAL